MNRTIFFAFLALLPIYGIRKASEEVARGLNETKTKITPKLPAPTMVAGISH